MAVTPAVQQQADEVLARLSQRRQAIESVIASVANTSLTLARVFERVENEPVYQFVYLVKLAEAVPGIGKVRARRILAELNLGERTRVAEVTVMQRESLLKVLR